MANWHRRHWPGKQEGRKATSPGQGQGLCVALRRPGPQSPRCAGTTRGGTGSEEEAASSSCICLSAGPAPTHNRGLPASPPRESSQQPFREVTDLHVKEQAAWRGEDGTGWWRLRGWRTGRCWGGLEGVGEGSLHPHRPQGEPLPHTFPRLRPGETAVPDALGRHRQPFAADPNLTTSRSFPLWSSPILTTAL